MSVLRLECDNVIVGGGLAGTIASMRLKGKTVVMSGGLGATALSGGVFSPLTGDADAESWFLETMGDTGCPYVRGKCITSMHTVKHGLVQGSTLYEGAPLLVSLNEERPGFTSIAFMGGHSLQEIARILDEDDLAIVELGRILSGIKAEKVLLPPILGITRAREIRNKVSELSGLDIGEYVTAPSALGLRLLNALRKKAAKNDGLIMLDTVKVERLVEGRVDGRMGTKGKRDISVHGNDLFIATGGMLTGFQLSGDRMFEPLTGATLSMDIEADMGRKFLSEHPLMSRGIGPDIFINGFDNVRVLGATACGFGLYKAMVSGFHAGDGL